MSGNDGSSISRLDANYHPFPAPKRFRTRMDPPFTGGSPTLTPAPAHTGPDVIAQPEVKVNGPVRATIQTRRAEQNMVNAKQLAWVDCEVLGEPVVMNLQQLNRFLIEKAPAWLADSRVVDVSTRRRADNRVAPRPGAEVVKRMERRMRLELEKAQIRRRFALYGVSVNLQEDSPDAHPHWMVMNKRTMTYTVRGPVRCMDYWSHRDNPIRPYDSLYFLLKRVKLGESGVAIQTDLTAARPGTGKRVGESVGGRWFWQVVPYHTPRRAVSVEALTFRDDDGDEHLGCFFEVGKVHEYADIGHASLFESRPSPLAVAHDMALLHGNSYVPTPEIYLGLGNRLSIFG